MDTLNKSFPVWGRLSTPSWPHALAAYLLLVLLMFADTITAGGSTILSSPHTDIASQFIYWRDFGFSELKKGNLALWNPHLFSGAPFFGGFQAALLYPLNVFYLFLPLSVAINTGIILHVLLLGFFMYLWAAQKAIHPLAALLTGILMMFCAPYFLHIYAGHLPNLCAMAWVPLIFLSLDGILNKPSLGWGLLGTFAFAMHILAGHPQYVYFTCLAALVYGLCVAPMKEKRLIMSGLAILASIVAGCALSAVQILTGIDAAQESVRTGGVAFSFAAMFSFPPENLITLIAPYFFGDMVHTPYWGRAYLWEMNLFIGVSGTILAIYSLIRGGKPARRLALAALILLILAFGAHTPLFKILFDYLPAFNKFRGTSKFIFFVALVLILLAGMGFDFLLRGTANSTDSVTPADKKRSGRRWFSLGAFPVSILLIALITAGCALYLRLTAEGFQQAISFWQYCLQGIAATGESYLDRRLFAQDIFIRKTASIASMQLFIAAAILAVIAWIWSLARNGRKAAVYGLFVLAILEVFLMARLTLTAFDAQSANLPGLKRFAASIQNDARILNLWNPNSALSLPALDLWGYDPGVARRYAELIAFTQGKDPKQASQYVQFQQYHPLLKLLRLRYILVPENEGLRIHEFPEAMARIQLVGQWQVANSDDDILKAMSQPSFNPRSTVILEKPPQYPASACPTTGTARIVSSSTDNMVIEARLSCPEMLLITDNFSRGWHVEAIHKNTGQPYEVLRADYTLMAIPLEAGYHLFKVSYRPAAFVIGAVISGVSLLLYGFTVLVWWVQKRKKA